MATAIGWHGVLCATMRGRRAWLHRLVPVAIAGACLVLAPNALAAPSFTWAGVSTTSDKWSVGQNWEGGTAPQSSASIADLVFPHLGSTACTTEPETHPCYIGVNNLGGLAAESLQIDDGNEYLIGGEGIDLGKGGLDASPEGGEDEFAGDFLGLPLHLTASQTWNIANASGGELDQNGVLLAGELTGASSSLAVDQSNGSALVLANDTNVGPVTFEGANTSGEHDKNGSVILEGEVNATDREPVNLRQIFFAGIGATGPLTAEDSTLVVGSELEPAGSLEAASVSLSPSAALIFEITGSGSVPEVDYSQLLSHGSVELDNAVIGVVAHPGEEGDPCPTVTPGEQFTFISTSGTLTGAFADAPEGGAEIPIDFEGCRSTHTMQITYQRTGAAETVTGTVEPGLAEGKPTILESPRSVTVTEGANATFTAAASGSKDVVQWKVRHPGGSFEDDFVDRGTGSDTLTIEHVTAAQNHNEYEAVFRNGAGETATAPATLTVEAQPEPKAPPVGPPAGKTTAQEEAERAATLKKHQEEEAAKGGVLSSKEEHKEGSPSATIADASLQSDSAGVVKVRVTCPSSVSICVGTVTMRTANAVTASAGKRTRTILTMAASPFTLAGGRSTTVTLRLSGKARTLLERSHSLRVRVAVFARDPQGGSHTDQMFLTLRAARPKHGG
jgi:hypothetical protein